MRNDQGPGIARFLSAYCAVASETAAALSKERLAALTRKIEERLCRADPRTKQIIYTKFGLGMKPTLEEVEDVVKKELARLIPVETIRASLDSRFAVKQTFYAMNGTPADQITDNTELPSDRRTFAFRLEMIRGSGQVIPLDDVRTVAEAIAKLEQISAEERVV